MTRRQDQIDRRPTPKQPLRGDRAVAPVVAVSDEHHDALARLHQPKHLCGHSITGALLKRGLSNASRKGSALERPHLGNRDDFHLTVPAVSLGWGGRGKGGLGRFSRVPRGTVASGAAWARTAASLAAVAAGGSRLARHRRSCADQHSVPL